MPTQLDHVAHNDTFTLRLVNSLDYEDSSVQSITVSVTDSTTPPLMQRIDIVVVDQNEAPTGILIDNLMIRENVAIGTTVGLVTVTDPDQTETFSCVLLDNSNGRFAMNRLNLVVAGPINYEVRSSHGITMECADKGRLVYTEVFTITVVDTNDAPTGIESDSGRYEVDENMPSSTRVALLSTTDEDVNDTFTYLVLNGTDKFTISGNQLLTTTSLNYEEESLYQVIIQSIDSSGESISVLVNIRVMDANDAPSDVYFIIAPIVPENASINTTVGRLGVDDEDTWDSHTFATSGTSSTFRVDQQGMVYTLASMDFEMSPELHLDVVAYDSGNLNKLKTVAIIVSDVNEAPHDIMLSTYETAENQPANVVVATVTVEDQDFNETFHCQLIQPPPFYFGIMQDEVSITLVTTNSTINYELIQTFLITLDCYDHGGLLYKEDIPITISDNNDPPTQIRFTNALYSTPVGDGQMLLTAPIVEIRENTNPGETITAISITDEDVGQLHTCEIFNSTYPNAFVITSTEPTLQTSESIDFEQIRRVKVVITCRDAIANNPQSVSAPLLVDIIDVNEPLSGISLMPNKIVENSPSGTPVGVFDFVDPDNESYVSIYIFTLNSASAPFVIGRNSSNWYLSVSRQAINYEALSSFTLSIEVLEINPEGNFSYAQTVEVVVEDVNEAPSGLSFHDGYTTVTVPSDTHPGIVVDNFTVIDEDNGDVHVFTIVGGNADQFFTISGQNLVLSEKLTPGSYDLILDVMATDSGNLTILRHFGVSVIDMSTCNTSNPCDINAFCFMYRPGQASCVCQLGYSGDGYSCTDIDYCKSSPCHPNNTVGRCKDGDGGIDNYTCECVPGYDPPNCYNETNECAIMPCDSVGTSICTDFFNDFKCTCRRGFTGKRCETDINDCENNPCKNNGTCTDLPGGYNCTCPRPYFGDHCEKDTTICDEDNPCPFNGVCDPSSDSCTCKAPYYHNCQHCEDGCYWDNKTQICVDFDECALDPGPCEQKNASLTCVNFEDRPCTFCCVDKNGNIDFCGPVGILGQLEDENSLNIVAPAVAVPVLLLIILSLLIILGLGYVRYRYVKGKNQRLKSEKYSPFEDDNVTDPVEIDNRPTSVYAENPLYSDPFATIQMAAANRSSMASSGGTRISYISNDFAEMDDDNNSEAKRQSFVHNPVFEDDDQPVNGYEEAEP